MFRRKSSKITEDITVKCRECNRPYWLSELVARADRRFSTALRCPNCGTKMGELSSKRVESLKS